MRLNTSCRWFYPAANSNSGGWIQVVAVSRFGGWKQVMADSILRLTLVPVATYDLHLTQSCGWLEFRRLNTSYSWFHPAADCELGLILSISAGWTRLATNLYFIYFIYLFIIFIYSWCNVVKQLIKTNYPVKAM